jgi:ABC-2 type transport system ATP-binding protein
MTTTKGGFMGEPIIRVEGLSKTYRVPQREPGLAASFRSLARRSYRTVEAVKAVSFTIQAGEIVGFLGPNGAGKTTTLKMLSGLLHPTGGTARVMGFVPWERGPRYLRQISMVLGNKSQMLWDIPPTDTFRVLAEIYGLERSEYSRVLDELVELLEMRDLLPRPVRTLSLGERMKCELVAGLLHGPRVLFLDEPTLGLDVSMQGRLRRFLAAYGKKTGVTMILTSHYMADVVALCPRVILIHRGGLLYDGLLGELAERIAPFKLIRLTLEADIGPESLALPDGVEIVERESGRFVLRAGRREAPSLTAHLLRTLPVADLSVEDPPIEAVIDRAYREGHA